LNQIENNKPSCPVRDVTPPNMKIGTSWARLEAYFRTKPSCPAFWGVTPRRMKTGIEDSKAYFRTKPSCPAFLGVAPRNMKIDPV